MRPFVRDYCNIIDQKKKAERASFPSAHGSPPLQLFITSHSGKYNLLQIWHWGSSRPSLERWLPLGPQQERAASGTLLSRAATAGLKRSWPLCSSSCQQCLFFFVFLLHPTLSLMSSAIPSFYTACTGALNLPGLKCGTDSTRIIDFPGA